MVDKIRLSEAEVIIHLAKVDGWEGDTDRIKKTFHFEDFLGSIAFINALVPHAEELDHHPELFNVYDRVEITMTTHDANGVTALDFELASRLDELALA